MKHSILLMILTTAFTVGALNAQFVPNRTQAGPRDGTGYGAARGKGQRQGTCDQTGPKGKGPGAGQGQGRSGRR
jgi:hypothetical protein